MTRKRTVKDRETKIVESNGIPEIIFDVVLLALVASFVLHVAIAGVEVCVQLR